MVTEVNLKYYSFGLIAILLLNIMYYKEIILKLLEAIDGFPIYKNPNFNDRYYGNFGHGRHWHAGFEKEYYRLFSDSSGLEFLEDIHRGMLLPIFKDLEEERALKITYRPECNQEYFNKLNIEIYEKEGDIYMMSQDLIDDLISFHFIKLENFNEYLKNLKEELSGKPKKILIKKGELGFNNKDGIIFYKERQIKIPINTNLYRIAKAVFGKPIGEKLREDDLFGYEEDLLDPEKEHKRTIRDACINLNKKIKNELGLEKLFINKAALVYLNGIYFS